MEAPSPAQERPRRRQYFVASHLQNPLLKMSLRHAAYMLLLVAVCLFLPPLIALARGEATTSEAAARSLEIIQLYRYYWPALLLGLVTVLCDAVIVSHRLAGPLHRMRKATDRAAAGEIPPEIHLRRKDYLHREADSLNALFAYTARLKAEAGKGHGHCRCEHAASDSSVTEPSGEKLTV